jgi:hypothetical protein
MVFGMSVALILGPYIVIGIGAMGGAAVMIMQRSGDGNVRAFIYFLASTTLAVFLTVPISMGVASLYGPLQETWLFAPVSFCLGFMGDRWPAVFHWGAEKINSLVDAWIASRGQR